MGSLERFSEAVKGIAVTGESTTRAVSITRTPDGRIETRIDPRWYRSVTPERFRAEVLSAIADAREDFTEQRALLFREHFRPHLDQEAGS